jgi:hypothetical protein
MSYSFAMIPESRATPVRHQVERPTRHEYFWLSACKSLRYEARVPCLPRICGRILQKIHSIATCDNNSRIVQEQAA